MGSGEQTASLRIADLSVCENAESFLQSTEWGRFKSRFGWKAKAFIVHWADNEGLLTERPLLVLSRRIAPAVTMAYIPWGPELPGTFPADPALRAAAAAELARTLRPFFHGAAFIRFDFPWNTESESRSPAPYFPLKKAADIQPPDTVIVDLTPSEQDILAAMKPKWRYNIGLAEKRGVTVSESDGGANSVSVFYHLLAETAARDGIAIHSEAYYRILFEEMGNGLRLPRSLRLYIAEHEGDTLAAIVTLFRGKQAVYLYGASSNAKRNLMAPYALQWRAMRDAKAFGCTEYDLFGIPPNEKDDHPMAGLYRFKTGFGGRIMHRPGSWDYPYKRALYALFCVAENLRKKIRDSRKRESRRTGSG